MPPEKREPRTKNPYKATNLGLATVQVVSDFGFFGRKKAEQFLESFEDTYYLRQMRISGDSVRCALLSRFPQCVLGHLCLVYTVSLRKNNLQLWASI